MASNSLLTVAVHILALLAIEGKPLTSRYIALSVNTNPVVIRRILGALSKAGLVSTQLGVEGGSCLARPPAQITLRDVYLATEPGAMFALHHSPPSCECPCGRNIQSVLRQVFGATEAAVQAVLAETTVADVAREIQACENGKPNDPDPA